MSKDSHDEPLENKSPMSFLVLTLVNATAQQKTAHVVATEIMDWPTKEMLAMLSRIEQAHIGDNTTDPFNPTFEDLDNAGRRVFQEIMGIRSELTEGGK